MEQTNDDRLLRKSISNSSFEDFRAVSQNSSTDFRPRSDSVESDNSIEFPLSRGSSQSSLGRDRSGSISLLRSSLDADEEDQVTLKVEVEDYLILKSSRVVTVVLSRSETVRQAMARIAKKNQIAMDVETAVLNYVLWIPNFDGTNRGIIMSMNRLLSSYGLKNRDAIVLKKKSTSLMDLQGPPSPNPSLVRTPSMKMLNPTPLAEQEKSGTTSSNLLGRFRTKSVTGPGLQRMASAASRANDNDPTKQKKCFGADLEGAVSAGNSFGIPSVVHKTIEWLESNALDVEGLFQKTGSERELILFRKAFDTGEEVDFSKNVNPLTVAELLKQFLEMLPEPLMSFQLYDIILTAYNDADKGSNENTDFFSVAKFFIQKLPVRNKLVLARLLQFFNKLLQHSDKNKLQPEFFPRVFGSIFLRPHPRITILEDEVQRNEETVRAVMAIIIKQYKDIFVTLLQREPSLIAGEKTYFKIDRVATYLSIVDDVDRLSEQPYECMGILWITNFRIHWIQSLADNNNEEDPFEFSIPFGTIFSVKKLKKTKQYAAALLLTCKDCRQVVITFREKDSAVKKGKEFLVDNVFQKSLSDTFAYSYSPKGEGKDGWKLLDMAAEYQRMGISTHFMKWRNSLVNSEFNVASHYPREIIVPHKLSDDALLKSAKARSVTWANSRMRSFLLQAGAPEKQADAESKLWEAFIESGNSDKILVIDTGVEPPQNWHANTFKSCKFDYLGLASYSILRENYSMLEKIVKPNRVQMDALSKPWLDQIRKVLAGCEKIVSLMETGHMVLIQEGAGCQMAHLVSSVAQLCLDSYYRTLNGFAILIEKQFLRFGFPFGTRMGHCTPPPKKTSADQTSPVWTFFIDIVWQLWRQFPIAFQFNEELLMFLLENSHSNLFGTFLYNSDKERIHKQVSTQTVSIWTAILASPQRFTNPFHINDSRTLKPSLDLTLWKGYYFHWNQTITFFQKKIRGTFAKTLFSETQELNLEKKGLVSLPVELTKCTSLVSINLNRNDFNTIPVELLHLTNLKDLNLSNNQIRGQSHDFFALFVERLNLLEHLTLRGNCMEQLPNVIGELNKLKTLDLSDNRFYHLPFTIAHISTLQKLVLNTNRMAQFPDLTDLTGLVYLDLSANSIAALESTITLKNLRVLKLAKNSLKSLPEKFDFPNLEELDLSANRIPTIPPTFFAGLKNTLKKLKIRANGLTALPPGFKELTLLTDLNLESNNLKEFSPDLLELSNLQRLNLNKNKITQIPNDIAKLKDLVELSISNNQLTALPPSIGQIEKLETLDASDNLLDSLPPTIALLTKLVDFRFDRNKLRLLPKSIVAGGPTIVFGYLKDLLKGSQKIYRSRVMVVGQENVGKTSLCNCLRKRFNNNKENITTLSTDGITIDTWTIQTTVDTEEGKQKQDIHLSMWDFAGQEIYYATHQFFMSKRCVYLIVWNLATDPDKSKIEFWLHSIKARAKSVSVFIIGTHLDHPKLNNEVATYILKRLEKKYKAMFQTLDLHFRAVSCSTGDGIKRLRFELEEIVLRQKHMGESVPTSFLLLERQLSDEASKRIPPVITKATLQQFASVVNIIDDRELSRASKTLHELGSIVHFDSDPKLSDMVVLSPRWLTEMLATVFTTKHNFAKNGILQHASLLQIWKPPEYPNKLHKSLLQLLEAFEIAFSLSPFDPEKYNGSSLIPSLLPVDPPEEFSRIWSASDGSKVPKNGYRDLKRIYKFDFIPFGLFGRLIVRLLKFAAPSLYWRNGIVMHNDEKKETVFIELSPEKNMIEITNRSTEAVASTPRDILETLETLIRHWYRVSMQVFVPCVHCLDERIQNPTLFPLDLCQTWAVSADKQYVNCNKNDIITAVRLDRLVPDLTMKDFSGSKISWEELSVGDIIGEGGAATVYKGTWNNQQVAIKKLRVQMEENRFSGVEEDDESFTKVFNEFRREVYIMSGLEHPNLVQLKGLCLDPLCIVTEFLSSGDLYGAIHNKEISFDWPLRLKIAMDIASGMSFLHSAKPPIIHRDLKSPNVLLSSLSVKSRVVAKVADFGLSGTIQTVATMEVANPRWLAPEIMLKGEFTTASDVYSFGVVLWELITREDFFGDTGFNSEIEKRVLDGKRPEIPASCPPVYAQLITECWSQQPNNRPAFKDIKMRLQEIKKELCIEFPSLHGVLSASTMDLAALLESAKITPSDLLSSPESSKENSISDYSTGHLTPPQTMSSTHRTSSAEMSVQEISNNNNNFDDFDDVDDEVEDDEERITEQDEISNSESELARSESSISLSASGPQELDTDSEEDV